MKWASGQQPPPGGLVVNVGGLTRREQELGLRV